MTATGRPRSRSLSPVVLPLVASVGSPWDEWSTITLPAVVDAAALDPDTVAFPAVAGPAVAGPAVAGTPVAFPAVVGSPAAGTPVVFPAVVGSPAAGTPVVLPAVVGSPAAGSSTSGADRRFRTAVLPQGLVPSPRPRRVHVPAQRAGSPASAVSSSRLGRS